jgi:hypothetical protein
MKSILIVFFWGITQFLLSQTYTDIANQQNVNVYLQTFDQWAVGMSCYDFNQDGWDDLSYPMHNDSVKFFVNNAGVFTEIPSFINSIGKMKQLLWVDYDNDHDLDIFTTYHDKGIQMHQNNGAFQFTDVTASIGFTTQAMFSYGASFADYDKDGFLDVYVANYESSTYFPGTTPHENFLYHNNGDGTFTDVTATAGVGNGLQTSFCGVWIDLNNDSWLDLHVINDRFTTLNALYINNGDGTFTDEAASWNLTMPLANPMSNSFSDFDNDNDYDLFVTNTSGATFQDDSYNFMVNNGNNQYTDLLNQYGIDSTHWAWGALWVDYDNDMFEDLLITTGELSPLQIPEHQSWFYKNNQGQSFTYWNDSILFNTQGKSFSPVKGDFNNDGFYDIAIQNDSPKNTFLMQNSGESTNNYIKIQLVTTVSNVQAIGTEIEVFAGGNKQMQTVLCGEGLCGQSSQYLIFGVGQSTQIDSIVTTFPSGIVKVNYGVLVNQKITISESTTYYVDVFPNDTIYLCMSDTLTIGELGYGAYQWNTGDSSATITVSGNGNYSFVASDTLGNIYISDTLTTIVNTMVAFAPGIVNDYCNLGLGSIELFPLNNPLVAYSVTWSNGQVGLINENLIAESYSYLYHDTLGCDYNGDTLFIENNAGHESSIITSAQTDLALGTLSAYSFGGISPYGYSLNGNAVNFPVDTLLAGTYELTIVDASGCMDSLSFEIIDQVIGLGIGEEYTTNSNAWYSEGFLFVDTEGQDLESIQIIDNIGRIIPLVNEINDDTKQSFNLYLSTGVYHVIFHTSNAFHQQIIVVN